MKRLTLLFISLLALMTGCDGEISAPSPAPTPDREALIPQAQEKISSEDDVHPPKSETDEYHQPVPLPYPVNTAGVEDSAFILPDGETLYLWFTPAAEKTPQEQLTDGVTGIYVFHKVGETWSPAERVLLQDSGEPALDGCGFVQNAVIWFCSARPGYTGLHWFRAEFIDGKWRNWQPVDFDFASGDQVGELHITADGNELYFHSSRPGGKGGYDIWVSKKVDGKWQSPENLAIVNTAQTDGWPFVTPDGSELWFTRSAGVPSLYRSKKVNGEWSQPELMFSNFAGEASLDRDGSVYFTHHFFKDDTMLEADIYVARRK